MMASRSLQDVTNEQVNGDKSVVKPMTRRQRMLAWKARKEGKEQPPTNGSKVTSKSSRRLSSTTAPVAAPVAGVASASTTSALGRRRSCSSLYRSNKRKQLEGDGNGSSNNKVPKQKSKAASKNSKTSVAATTTKRRRTRPPAVAAAAVAVPAGKRPHSGRLPLRATSSASPASASVAAASSASLEFEVQALRGDMQHLKRELAGAKQAAAGAAAEVEELQQSLAAATAAQQEGLAKQAELVLALEGAQAGAAELEARVSSLSTSLATREEELVAAVAEAAADRAQAREDHDRLLAAHEAVLAEVALLRDQNTALIDTRRRLLGQVLDLRGAVRVFCRVRPVLSGEAEAASSQPPRRATRSSRASKPAKTNDPLMHFPDAAVDATALELVEPPAPGVDGTLRAGKRWPFSFNRVFGPLASQADVFEDVADLVQSAVDGHRVCIFAYGQTGAGKTYTMNGADHTAAATGGGAGGGAGAGVVSGTTGGGGSSVLPQGAGIIPRALHHVFAAAEELRGEGWSVTPQATMVEIYNETLRDLLLAGGTNAQLDIRHDKDGVTSVTNLTTVEVTDQAAVAKLLSQAAKNRAVGATSSNARSSRSHSVFQLLIQAEHSETAQKRRGVIALVDLAGSERLSASRAHERGAARMRETQSINRSLAALGNVIGALSARQQAAAGAVSTHIPYRDSKLTYLLKGVLEGAGARVLMLVNISPLREHAQESLCSLRFAAKVNSLCLK